MTRAVLPPLDARDRQPEQMDQPGLDAGLHAHALRSLARVNRVSGAVPTLWSPIRRFAKGGGGRPIRVLDVACGGGDVAIGLARRAARSRIPVEVAGCDISETTVAHASAEASRRGAAVDFFTADALGEALPGGYDVVMSTLFLHHLERDDARTLLANMGAAAGGMVLLADLIRGRLGYTMAVVGTRLLTTSQIARSDGLLSVRASFTMPEVRELAESAGLNGVDVRRRWPERYLLSWSR